MAWLKQATGLRRVATNRGDTLRAIALRELGDATLWTDLAAINNLLPPYIVDDLSEVTSSRVLLSGSLISIPGPVPSQANGVADDASQLGTDFLLVGGMLTDDGAADIATVSSYDNLKQALEHRLQTRPRELIQHPTYGCRVFSLLGQGNGPVVLQLAAAWTGRCINSDPRVTETTNLIAVASGDGITVSGNAVPVTGKAVPVGATLGTS